jgi:hypothetical protein
LSEVFARLRPSDPDPEPDPNDPFVIAARMFDNLFARVDQLEANKSGLHGRDGRDGDPGRGISNAAIDAAGHFVLTFTDGTQRDVGRVAAAPAPAPKALTFIRDAAGRITRSELS